MVVGYLVMLAVMTMNIGIFGTIVSASVVGYYLFGWYGEVVED